MMNSFKTWPHPSQTKDEERWRRGILAPMKLHPCQMPLYNNIKKAIKDPNCLKYTVNCARRFGKSSVLFLIAVEFGIQNPNSQIRFYAAFHKLITEIVEDLSLYILDGCPDYMRPVFKKGKFYFHNGSILHLAGLDNKQHNSSRGKKAHLLVIDEAGFIDDIKNIYESVLSPTTMGSIKVIQPDKTIKLYNGTTIFASTPPESPAHSFKKIVETCEALGFSSTYTMDDNHRLDEETKRRYADEVGGIDSVKYQREFMCKFITDANKVVIPEWRDKFVQATEHDEYYEFYHKYVSMDLGVVNDYTVGILAYYDFKQATLFIEDEFVLIGNDNVTTNTSKVIKEKETALWGEKPKVYQRIMDSNNPNLTIDLSILHDLHFIRTSKTSLEAMINRVRILVQQGRIKVHPRCTQTKGCLSYAVWKVNKDGVHAGLDRAEGYGHFDALMALTYLVMNLDENTNPIPQLHGIDQYNTMIMKAPDESMTNNHRVLEGLVRPHKR